MSKAKALLCAVSQAERPSLRSYSISPRQQKLTAEPQVKEICQRERRVGEKFNQAQTLCVWLEPKSGSDAMVQKYKQQ